MNLEYKKLEDVISSKGGQHISLYLQNDEHILRNSKIFIHQILKMLLRCYDFDTAKKLISPLSSKVQNKKFMNRLDESVAIFKKDKYLRITNAPTSTDNFFVLSNTFHVKPLLTEKQMNSEGTLIFCSNNIIKVYAFDSYKCYIKNTFNLDTLFNMEKNNDSYYADHFLIYHRLLLNWMEGIFGNDYKSFDSPYILYGEPSLVKFIASSFQSATEQKILAYKKDENYSLNGALSWARAVVQKEKKKLLENQIHDFAKLKDDECLSYNFQEILAGLLSGQVKRLMIAKDRNIFGKINAHDGTIEFTHFHKDHEDDDLLDDFAQIALNQGLNPLLVKSSQIKGRRPIQAVLSKVENPVFDFDLNLGVA